MQNRLGAVLAIILGTAPVAGAQATVDYTTRTVSVFAAATAPAANMSYGGVFDGMLDTHLLIGTDAQNLVFHFAFPTVSATVSGLTVTDGSDVPAQASVWFHDRTVQKKTRSDGTADNEYDFWADSTMHVGFTPSTDGYAFVFSANAWANLAGQGAGASASSTAIITLLGVNAVNNDGTVISSAVFDDSGNGYFTTAPEPSSLILVSVGTLWHRAVDSAQA